MILKSHLGYETEVDFAKNNTGYQNKTSVMSKLDIDSIDSFCTNNYKEQRMT